MFGYLMLQRIKRDVETPPTWGAKVFCYFFTKK
jgi:hypothetical protein